MMIDIQNSEIKTESSKVNFHIYNQFIFQQGYQENSMGKMDFSANGAEILGIHTAMNAAEPLPHATYKMDQRPKHRS